MRPIFLALLVLLLPVHAADGKEPDKGKKPAPPPGIHWAQDFAAGMRRAAQEGRPVFVAVNALETESANNWLAQSGYRSKAWGDATRGFVSFVCNPNTHADGPRACTRYPGHTCAGHKAALDWFLKRFGQELISPQHVILEPDGLVAYRKEYYERVVGPSLLENYLSKLAPSIALARAGVGREAHMKQVGNALLPQVEELARAWLDGRDGLAAAAIANLIEDSFDTRRRLAFISALRHTPPLQVPVLVMSSEDRVMYPADEPAETWAWLRTLFEADRKAGVWAATRILVRLADEPARDLALRIWAGSEAGSPGIDDLPERERAHAYEALILAKDQRARVANPKPASWTQGREEEIRRAWRVSGRTTQGDVALKEELTAGHPKRLRPALLRARAEEVRANVEGVLAALRESPYMRVRIAAAIALLRARVRDSAAQTRVTILFSIRDEIEGPSARAAAIAVLGDDPGQDPAEWERVLTARLEDEK